MYMYTFIIDNMYMYTYMFMNKCCEYMYLDISLNISLS